MAIGKKEQFLRIYSNLPLGLRQEIILVLDDGRPMTWNAAFFEVYNDTMISDQILDKLDKLEII